MEAFLWYKEVGDVYAVFVDMHGHKYKIHCMKGADYVMKLFSTHGSLSKWCHKTSCTYKDRVEMVTKVFCYPEPMDIHVLYRHHIYDHNNCRHQPIGLDSVRGTNLWRDRVFTLPFSVAEINTYKLHHHFKEFPERSILDFRFELAFRMILNEMPGSMSNPD